MPMLKFKSRLKAGMSVDGRPVIELLSEFLGEGGVVIDCFGEIEVQGVRDREKLEKFRRFVEGLEEKLPKETEV